MIAVEHLTKWYGDVRAVDDITFEVSEGEVVGFLGPNGAGKTTTLRILTAFMPASAGSVRIGGFDVLTQSLQVRRRLGYLPETVPIYPDMRVEEFLRFRALLKGVSRKGLKGRVEAALDRCGCLDMRRRMIGKLSKGYRQRVGLADAIVHDPPLLVLDEPTSGLDPNQRVSVRELISSLGENKTVILSSHILAEVEAVAERVIIINRGQAIADGEPGQILRKMGVGSRVRLEARASPEQLRSSLRRLEGTASTQVEPLADEWAAAEIQFEEPGDHRERVGRIVQESGFLLRELASPTTSLEDLFRRLTADEGGRP
ncbi:MAG: ATP-binding cassette domain-containing protein [Planctomycetota bacterium]